MSRKIITTEETEEDKKIEGTLRPRYLKEYIGQEKIKSTLKIFIDAAKTRGEALDHVLFYGPPGLGKTTLCGIIANEMGVNLKVTSGPAIEKPERWRRSSTTSRRGTCCSWMRSTGSTARWRRSCIPQGGLCHRHHAGKGFCRPFHPAGASEVYPGGSHHQGGTF